MTFCRLLTPTARVLFAPLFLAACMFGGAPNNVDPVSQFRTSDLKSADFTASTGQRFRIKHTFSSSISRYGVEVEALSGVPLGPDASGDARAQNAIREYFNRTVCSEGYAAGITAIKYSPHPDQRPNSYGATLFCTSKQQAAS